ncbi:P-selectin glycoprotein ligand 1 isoform X2 [Ahaetulla prasina]|uniref:P-selectin glycoprotein ligand 1 isoform X2 n=1 Tax=Ahaetulla prasina TaxID=499056 RepID=UPI002648B68F|nr:P-selectin glycoprotein ligand 1 isoform X2 [Ahaetulla prasina]
MTCVFHFLLLASGKMASQWIFWPMVLSGVLLSGDFKSIQDGISTKNMVTPANTNDWKWKTAAEESNGSFSQLLHQGRQDPMKNQTKKPPALPTASRLSMALQEETTSFPKEIVTKVAFKGSPKNLLPQTNPSKMKSKPLPLEMTVTWPWLVDVTSKPSQAPLSTLTLEQDFETTGPGSTQKDTLHPSFKKVTPSLAFSDDLSTAPSHDLIDDSGFSTATQNHIPHSPKPDTKSKIKLPLIAAASATPQHLDEILSTSQTLVDDTEFSTPAQKHTLDSGGPGLNPRAKPPLAKGTSEPHKTQKWLDEMVSTSLAFSARSPRQSLSPTTSGSSATTQGKSPLADDTSPLIEKCLLAILLLALVAAIFIVCSGVLAIMLCRQKRAYRLGQANHTEMVCISSLLSAEKEEEEEEERRRRRQPKVKRVQLLGETASETEADNLTLNSFLPEH